MTTKHPQRNNFILQALATAAVCITTAMAVSSAIGRGFEQTAVEAQRRTRIELTLEDHDEKLRDLGRRADYLVDAMRRVELRLGTSPQRASDHPRDQSAGGAAAPFPAAPFSPAPSPAAPWHAPQTQQRSQ